MRLAWRAPFLIEVDLGIDLVVSARCCHGDALCVYPCVEYLVGSLHFSEKLLICNEGVGGQRAQVRVAWGRAYVAG